MTYILSEHELVDELNKFRDVLLNFDYSEISNVIFFDINSLNHYIENYNDNPFEKQYNELELILNKLFPYLPNSLPNDTIDIIANIIDTKYNDHDLVRQNILFNIKMEFIQTVKDIRSEKEWEKLIMLCKKIRNSKERVSIV